jgi:putative peptidoglycan lipid II flippase
MRNFLKNSTSILTDKQSGILSAAFIIMVAVLASGLLGIVKNRLLVGAFFGGNEWQLDVYFAAFRLPDMIFQLLVTGSLSAAFIPVFSELLEEKEKKAYEVASSVINIGFLIFIVFSGIIFIFAKPFSQLIAQGFSPEKIILMVKLTRIMLIAQLFFIVSNFLTGIVQSHQRFLIPAFAPVAYNLGIIFGVVVLSPMLGIYGPTVGVVIGAFLHFIIQLPLAFNLGFKYSFLFDIKDKFVREIGRLMLPRTIALAVSQIDLTNDVFLASTMAVGSLSIFYFAQNLMLLPVRLFGATIGQASLPALSREYAKKDIENFKKILLSSLNQILYLTLLASTIIIILRVPIVRIALGAKNFTWKATILTSKTLAFFAISIFAQALIHLLARAFYALHDTKTPLIISICTITLNVILSLFFTFWLGLAVFGLALATSIANIINVCFLLLNLAKKVGGFSHDDLTKPVLKIFSVALMTAFALYIPMKFLDRYILDTTRTVNLIVLTAMATVSGTGVYFLMSWVLGIKQLQTLVKLFYRVRNWQEALKKQKSSGPLGTLSQTEVTEGASEPRT